MQPLHDSYENLGIWTWVAEGDRLCLRYDGRRARLRGSLVAVACLAFAAFLAWLSERAGQSSIPCWIIGSLTSIVVAFSLIRRAGIEEKKGDILQINTAADTVWLPRDTTTVHRAKDRLQFSYELQWLSQRYNSELNYLLGGERKALLAELGTDGSLSRISRKLSELGFVVNSYKSPQQRGNS